MPGSLVFVDDARLEQRRVEPERGQERREGAVQLVAEPAPASHRDLLDERVLLEHDRHTQVDVEVLERHGPQVRHVQATQPVRVHTGTLGDADPIQVGRDHSHSIVPGGLLVMSYATRFTPGTSRTMRDAIVSSRSGGRRAQSAVMASSDVTARTITGFS